MQKDVILGLSVGTQFMGLALVKGRTLENWQVKNFEGKWSKIKLKIILTTIQRYIEENSVTCVALKIPEPFRSSTALIVLTDRLNDICKSKGVKVATYTINDLKTACNASNKAELTEMILAQYPELKHIYTKCQKVKRVYYVKIFEAVACTKVFITSNK